MIDLYYWTTPNGHKVSIMLEEIRAAYNIHPINIGRGDQFDPDFLKIAPNNRIPAIVDHAPTDGGAPISIFESGAILQYLAEKSGQLGGRGLREKTDVNQWLMWQMGGLGPMAGQNHHFNAYAPEKLPYAIKRYVNETARLYGVMNKRLADRDYLAGDYSIADIASYPWVVSHKRQDQDLNDFPHLKNWFERIHARSAVQKAYALAEEINTLPSISDDKARDILFNQDADTVKK